jgi:anion-transporting  ArsA/GET3 family ATPase
VSEATAPAQPHPTPRLGQRLLIVTGKGGVGKSTVAAALALECAARGERTLLVAHSPQDAPHPVFGTLARYAPAPVKPNLSVSRVDGHAALKEYVRRSLWPARLYDWVVDSRALAHFTEAAPGFDELMSLGKIYDYCTGKDFDRVVLDAPSTGHALLMLKVARVTTSAVRTGPLHHNALKIQLMLENDTRTAVVLVALPEEMSVRETLELRHRLEHEAAIRPGPVLVNRIRAQLFSQGEIEALDAVADPSPTLARMIATAKARFRLSQTQAEQMQALGDASIRPTHLPEIIRDRHDAAGLAEALRAHVAPILAGATK